MNLGYFSLIFCAFVTLIWAKKLGRITFDDNNHIKGKPSDFIKLGKLEAGEDEAWLSYKGLFVKQITTHGDKFIVMRQATDGRHLVQAVLDNNEIALDCDVSKDPAAILKFSIQFMKEAVGRRLNKRIEIESKSDIPRELKPLMRFRKTLKTCRKFLQAWKKAHTKSNELPEKHEKLINLHHKGIKSRSKRSIEDKLIFPGTKWCGKGNVASNYSDLGEHTDADRCCRTHDHCPYTITSFAEKYGLLNIRFHTVSHCDCDYRFRTCLRSAGTEMADMVGRIFFDIYQLKCFVFTPEKKCAERYWYGLCKRHEIVYEASVQGSIKYEFEDDL